MKKALCRAVTAIFGGNVANGFTGNVKPIRPGVMLPEQETTAHDLKERAEAADFGTVTAQELERRVQESEAHPVDVKGCLMDTYSIVSGKRGQDALSAFCDVLAAKYGEQTAEQPAAQESRSDEAASDNAERWNAREAAAHRSLKRLGIEYKDHHWGAVFTGSKSALIKAGLLTEKLIPGKVSAKEFNLPLNWQDGYNAACFGSGGAIPPRWDARASVDSTPGKFSVYVNFRWGDEMDIRGRMEAALAEVDRADMNPILLRHLILSIPPVPLSVVVPEAIKAARKFPASAETMKRLTSRK